MKVKCIANTGKDLSKISLESGQQTTTKYSISIGMFYTVYSIDIWNGSIKYLLDPDQDNYIFWYPAELFEIIDSSIPSEWFFAFKGYDPFYRLYAVLGYKELLEQEHFNGLLEREEKDLAIFFKRKQELNACEEIKNIHLDKKGKIISGEKTGWDVYIKDDIKNSDGYLVILSKKDETFVEDWVKDKEELRRLFNTKEWKIAWQE